MTVHFDRWSVHLSVSAFTEDRPISSFQPIDLNLKHFTRSRFCNFGKVQPLNWRKIGVRQIGGGCGGREGGWCRISAAVGQKGGWKIFKFNSSFMRIRHSWSNLNIWRFNGKRPIKKVTEFAHFLVKHENTKNTEVCGLSDFSRMHCELILLHKSF